MTDVERPADVESTSPRGRRIDASMPDPRVQVRSASRTGRGGKRRARKRKRHTVAKVVLSTLLVLGMVSGLAVAYLYRQLNGNLTIADYAGQIVEPAPEKVQFSGPTDPINILIMGEDSRDCEGCGVDGENTAGLSDTTILLHLSRDRKHAYGISIPRDSLVERPDCRDEEGEIIEGSSRAMWNTAFAYGGPACTISQFQHVTGIAIDYSVTVNFGGFKGMVDAVGGVDVCVPETFYDSYTKTTFKAGTRKLSGKKALAYVRVRHNIGDGSDIGRTRRQQAFIASMVSEVMSANTLANPIKVVSFLNEATKSLELAEVNTTGLGNIQELAGLALQFKNISLDKIEFITVPFVYGSGDERGRVVWTDEADEIWERIREDRALGDRLTAGSIRVDHLPGGEKTPTAPAGEATDGPTDEPTDQPTDEPSAGSSPSADAPTDEATPTDEASPADGRSEEEKAQLEFYGLCT